MEFPEDILGLIRAFSKPVFRHAKEFREILKVLRLSSWISIEAKLCSCNADRVIELLRVYRDAFVVKKEIRIRIRNSWQDYQEEYEQEYKEQHYLMYDCAVALQKL